MTRKEVVVIVVAIGILGYILVLALQKPMPKTSSWNCTCSLRELGSASALYASDNKGVLPGPQPMGIGIPEVSWDRPLAIQRGTNLGKDGVYEPLANLTMASDRFVARRLATFKCPQDVLVAGARSIPEVPGSLADGTAAGNGICRSYTMNLGSGNLVPGVDDGISSTADAIPVSKVVWPAGTIHLIENQDYATVFGQRNIANDTYITCDRITGTVTPKDMLSNPLKSQHYINTPLFSKKKKMVNALMHDGHVELLDQVNITADHGKVMQYIK